MVCLGAIAMLTSSACTIIDGNGVVVEETRELPSFSEVDLSGQMRLNISVDPATETPFALEIHGEENLMPYIRTRFDGRRLVIDETEWLSPSRPIHGTLTVPSLRGIEVGSSSSVSVSGIDQRTFRIASNGGQVHVAGQVDELSVLASGSSDVDALELVTWRAHADLTDNSSVRLCVEDTLEASASGHSDLRFACRPFHIFEDVRESGSVSRY